ncbi:MAG: hypothetical protein QM702_05270 [Rubrivivax sp.]
MPTRLFALLALLTALLSGCDRDAVFERLMPKEEARQAQLYVAQIAARDYAALKEAMAPELRTPDLDQRLQTMSRMLPPGPPTSVKTVGANTLKAGAVTTYTITLEYEYPNTHLVAAVTLERHDDRLVLKGITFVPRTQSLEEENRFKLDGKGPLHYLVLALAVAVPLFVLYALVLCARTKFLRRKWLWLLFVAVGFVQFQFNWSTGDWGVIPLSVLLLGSGFATSGPYAPWIFTIALPVGAIVFLLRRPSLQRPTA